MTAAFALDSVDTDTLDGRFGRAKVFRILQVSGEVENVSNEFRDLPDAAGVKAVQFLASKGVRELVAPHLGPKAQDAAQRLGLKVWLQGECRTYPEAVRAWKAGTLKEQPAAPQAAGLYRA